jgi:hypothetical protein
VDVRNVLDCSRGRRERVAKAFNRLCVHCHCGNQRMTTKLTINLNVDVPARASRRTDLDPEDERAMALAEAVIVHLLPHVASKAGVEKHRLAGSLLVELGYIVGLSHTPAAAVDALAVATERLRDALTARRDPRPVLPTPTVLGPTTLQ